MSSRSVRHGRRLDVGRGRIVVPRAGATGSVRSRGAGTSGASTFAPPGTYSTYESPLALEDDSGAGSGVTSPAGGAGTGGSRRGTGGGGAGVGGVFAAGRRDGSGT